MNSLRILTLLFVLAALAPPVTSSAQSAEEEPLEAPLVEPMLRAPTAAEADSVLPPPTLDPLRRQYRSARLAVAMTMIVPGWGQLYGDSPFWAVVAYSVQMFYIGNVVMENRRAARQEVRRDAAATSVGDREVRDLLVTEHRERARDFIWWGAAGYLIIGLDAFVTVQLFGFDAPDPPTPDLDRDWGDEPASGEAVGLALTFDF